MTLKTTLLVFICACSLTQPCAAKAKKRQVLLVSMDGFRHDYLDKTQTPNFDALRKSGVSMDYMNNTFVTSTFPNHYTMVTGLFTESHGIIANAMYDPVLDDHFTTRNNDTEWWNGGEPIWITAVKAGLTSGVYFWPGSNVEIQNMRATHWLPYKQSTPFETRVNVTIGWLVDGIDLACIYFHEPDYSGHNLGPDNPGMLRVIQRMDAVLGDIIQALKDNDLQDNVNVIVTSDHGMAALDIKERVIDLSKLVNSSLLQEVVEKGAFAHLRPQPGKAQELFDVLNGTDHMQVWRKADIPERFHLKNSRRCMEVFALAEEGWVINPNMSFSYDKHGGHGYDNYLPNMKPIFMATGPAFKSGVKVPPITNRDIYPLICKLLDITPSPNNGSLHRVAPLLENSAATLCLSGTVIGAVLLTIFNFIV